MRSNLIYSAAIFLLSSLIVNAQTDLAVSKKEFKLNRPGFNEAWKHISDGDSYFAQKGIFFNDAFNEYLQALVYNSSNAELNYKTGVSALLSDKKEEAADFFQKAWELKKNVSEDILLVSGRALMYNGRYTDAMAKFTEYLNSKGKKSKKNTLEAREFIHECTSALLITKDTLRISVTNAGQNINSPDDEYSEVLTSDGSAIYYASRRETSTSGKRHSDTKYDENILVSRSGDGGWGNPVIAGKELATRYCETPLYINKSNTLLYVYDGSTRNGDIKVSEYRKGSWRVPQRINYRINSRGNETSFAISPLGAEIAFVSDKGKDNLGGKDIYFIQQSSTGRWSKPFNAGPVINTTSDEEGVRFSTDGDTLWFSSRGHNSIGGFDIFYSVRGTKGWEPAINYGYPVNTSWDELFYVPSPVNDSVFYFASNRSGGYGGFDIYEGRTLPEKKVAVIYAKPEPLPVRDTVVIVKQAPAPVLPVEQAVYLVGKITDSESGEAVLAKVDLKELSANEIVGTTASSETDGSYRMKLPGKKSYNVDLHATGFLSDTRRIDVPENWSQENYNLNIDLIKVKVGKKVVLKNILFETGKSILTTNSYTELEHLLNILTENEEMKIEISGHTDKTGSEPVNARLSQARAKAVVDYLVSQGVDNTRMIFKGYGSSQPISDNTTPAGRAKNRRVEFKILEF